MTAYGNATDCIYTIIQTPLQSLTGNLPAFIIIILIAQLLWFFGIHGSMTVLPILFPIWLSYIEITQQPWLQGKQFLMY